LSLLARGLLEASALPPSALDSKMSEIYTEIYKIVQSIPKGRVLTYGLISHLIGGRMSAQGVGWALKALDSAKRAKPLKPSSRKLAKAANACPYDMFTVPWQRVVNAQGGTSTHKIGEIPPGLQRQLLESEGVIFNDDEKMDLRKFLWVEGFPEYFQK
jgi:methylated-DNA-protein-cysteine methyltransferase related protein